VVPWSYALYGAAIVAGLFALGNWAIVYYFSVTHMASAFGAAGGVAAVMVWIYYSAIIVLLGAQVSRATRRCRGRRSESYRPRARSSPAMA
jgi:membrane protein